jgi:hypothetical protein
MTRLRSVIPGLLTAILVMGLAVPAGAAPAVDQTFEDETWDGEAVEGDWLPAIEELREAHPYLADVRSLDMTRTHRIRGYNGKGLRVTIPPGGYRGFGPYARLPRVVDEAWFRYMIRLDGFYPTSSGKLPGLADASTHYTAKGCNPSTESDPGWSGRLMFDAVGTHGAGPREVPIGLYLYHLDQASSCGDELMFGSLAQGRWYCIEGRVRMNSPGLSNGVVEVLVDGERLLRRSGLRFRRATEPEIGVRELWDNVYFGGKYATPNQLALTIDEMEVSATGRVRCSDPFSDDNSNIHRGALTELYDRGLLLGCHHGLACPEGVLTRAQFAAMLHRVLRPPSGPDAFSDDQGHFAERAIDSLAGIGVLKGCDPPANTLICPDAPVTRAEVAAMVDRALDLPDGPDSFADDDGHWAEAPIDALAAAGITHGCSEAGYCPERTMVRGEAASFTVRVDDLVSETLTPLAAPQLPPWPPSGPAPVKPLEEREWPPVGE